MTTLERILNKISEIQNKLPERELEEALGIKTNRSKPKK